MKINLVVTEQWSIKISTPPLIAAAVQLLGWEVLGSALLLCLQSSKQYCFRIVSAERVIITFSQWHISRKTPIKQYLQVCVRSPVRVSYVMRESKLCGSGIFRNISENDQHLFWRWHHDFIHSFKTLRFSRGFLVAKRRKAGNTLIQNWWWWWWSGLFVCLFVCLFVVVFFFGLLLFCFVLFCLRLDSSLVGMARITYLYIDTVFGFYVHL